MFIDFLEREREREREKISLESGTSVASHTNPDQGSNHSLGMCPHRAWNPHSFGVRGQSFNKLSQGSMQDLNPSRDFTNGEGLL